MKKHMYSMKNTLFWILFIIMFFCADNTSGLRRSREIEDLDRTVKSDHFVIFYDGDTKRKHINDFAKKCEDLYGLINDRFGFNRYNFWLWDDRVSIYLYKDKDTYLEKSGRGEWSAASVNYSKKIIKTFYQEEDFFDAVLPHELAHIVLREFIGLKAQTPLWFDEGVAVVNENNCLQKYMFVAKCLIDRGFYLPVNKMDNITNDQLVTPSVFYPMAGSLIVFLIEEYGRNDFAVLCSELKENTGFYEAIESVYGIKGPDELNQYIVEYLRSADYEKIKSGEGFNEDWP